MESNEIDMMAEKIQNLKCKILDPRKRHPFKIVRNVQQDIVE
jgi:hypothetical protein